MRLCVNEERGAGFRVLGAGGGDFTAEGAEGAERGEEFVVVGAGYSNEIRSISLLPSCQGCSATLQLRVLLAASTVASATFNDSDTEPSSSIKSTVWPVSPVWGLSFIFTVPDAHSMRWMFAEALLASVKDAGLRMPLEESAAMAEPSVTGSKNASWRVPPGAVTVTVH